MPATKILWGQIVIVFTIVLATMWAATQWVAWKLGYPTLHQPRCGGVTQRMGRDVGGFGGHPLATEEII